MPSLLLVVSEASELVSIGELVAISDSVGESDVARRELFSFFLFEAHCGEDRSLWPASQGAAIVMK